MTQPAPAAAARAGFVLMTILLALWVMPSRNYPLNANAEASPEKLALGIAATPYQYRALVPWIAGQLTPEPYNPTALKARYWWTELIALVGLGIVFRRFLSLFIAGYGLTSIFALALYAILPFNYRLQDYYPYDIPSVLFFCAGLILVYQRRWALFYPLFALATLNRETSIFLTLATVLVWYDGQRWPRTLALAVTQCAVWLAIKWFLFEVYRGNPSIGYGLFQSQLKMNAALVIYQPATALTALATWAYLWIPVTLGFGRIVHHKLRRTLLIVPCVVVMMLFVGVINETRIYGELLPVVLAGAAVVFIDYLRTYFRATARPLLTAD